MDVLRRWTARISSLIRGLPARVRLAAAALAVTILAGGAWLIWEAATSGPDMQEVLPGAMSPADVQAAVQLAGRHGMSHRVQGGRLLAPPQRLAEFRSLLAAEGLPRRGSGLTFEQLAGESDIFSSPTRDARRWQAAKMAALSRLIEHFPGVSSATVIFEPGEPRGLGRPSVPPTAAVKVSLAQGAKVTGRLARAIADLVSGSIAGMAAKDVRVIDGAGQSVPVDAEGELAREDPIERVRQAEAHYAEKVRLALHYVDSPIIGVCADGECGPVRCRSASVCVPRSYLVWLYRAAQPDLPAGQAALPVGRQVQPQLGETELAAFAAPRLGRIRQVVEDVLGITDAEAVTVTWYDDRPAGAAAPAEFAAGTAGAAGPRAGAGLGAAALPAALAGGLAALGIACGVLAGIRGGLRRRSGTPAAFDPEAQTRRPGSPLGGVRGGSPAEADGQVSESSLPSEAFEAPPGDGDLPTCGRQTAAAAAAAAAAVENPLGALQAAGSDELLALLQGEHAQTAALVLAHMPDATAAAVLAGMARDRQVEVARRMAQLGVVGAEIVQEIARGLALRRSVLGANQLQGPAGGAGGAGGVGGVGKVAGILRHAGHITEQSVLDGLTGQEPALAESIRRRMFAFEDVVLLPADVLQAALAEIGSDELAIALRTAGGDVTERVLSSLPRPLGKEVRGAMDRIGPVRLSDVEAAQERVVTAVRRYEAGRYVSAASGREEEVLA